jgi:hypothetical protein
VSYLVLSRAAFENLPTRFAQHTLFLNRINIASPVLVSRGGEMIHCPAIPLEENPVSGDRIPLLRRLAKISALVAMLTSGIAAVAWLRAGKSHQERAAVK